MDPVAAHLKAQEIKQKLLAAFDPLLANLTPKADPADEQSDDILTNKTLFRILHNIQVSFIIFPPCSRQDVIH
jgi:hypothetical protein